MDARQAQSCSRLEAAAKRETATIIEMLEEDFTVV